MSKGIWRFSTFVCVMTILVSISGVCAAWMYAPLPPKNVDGNISIHMNDFGFVPDMPEKEAGFLERLNDILNNKYDNDIIPEGQSKQYIIDTMNKDWGTGVNPLFGSFVGSMDPNDESKERIDAMFGDCIDFNSSDHVSFILKSEDLVGDIADEIAVYSTSDILTWSTSSWTPTVVGVYLSVFVPVRNETQEIIGYELLCDSVHGYCMEVEYIKGDNTPSFSTDHWRDELFYWHEKYADLQPIKGEDRYKYECYHPADGCYAYPNRTISWMGWIEVETDQWNVSATAKGKKASQKLAEILQLK